MNRNAQAIVLTALGAVALRVGITDEYARYVNEWMRWPLVVSGALLVALAFTRVFGRDDAPALEEHGEHGGSRAIWALLVPIVVAFVIQPPALGAYVADRRVNEVRPDAQAAVAPLADGATTDMLVSEFVALAATYGQDLEGHDVRLTGFVTRDGDDWFVTRLAISCCAADASAFRVQVRGVTAPAEEQWVQVTGQWVRGTGDGASTEGAETPVLDVADPAAVVAIDEPRRPYE